MNDIELASNWKGFFRGLMVCVPIALYFVWNSSFLS
jgi:hypothetical protein